MQENKLKIIFVGMPDMALVCLANLIKADFNIVGVVPPKKTHETYEYFKNFVSLHKLNLIEFENSCNDKDCIEKIAKLEADIGVICSYNYLLSEEFIKTTKLGYINCHPSKLPEYRGAAPYFHIVNNGEKTSAITLHFIDKTFDTGDIVFQKEFKILPDETMGTLFNRTNYMFSDALIETLKKLENNEELKRLPQDTQGSYIEAPRVGVDFKIRWNNPVQKIESLIKACNPFYNAFCFFRGTNLRIMKASAIIKKHNKEFGKIIQADKEKILITANGGYLSLEIMQLGTWGIFEPKEFHQIFSPKIGEFLT